MKRLPETLKWDRELYVAMNFCAWVDWWSGCKTRSWLDTTLGCKACDEEGSGVKRRDRPFNHTPAECAEKQAVFREGLREMKMLSADEAPPVMEPVAGPVLPWLSTRETAWASSSSSGVVIPQTMAVEPDQIVRGGLKRASVGGDMEIAEIFSLTSDVNVNGGTASSSSCDGVLR